jgi:hypothetical protein
MRPHIASIPIFIFAFVMVGTSKKVDVSALVSPSGAAGSGLGYVYPVADFRAPARDMHVLLVNLFWTAATTSLLIVAKGAELKERGKYEFCTRRAAHSQWLCTRASGAVHESRREFQSACDPRCSVLRCRGGPVAQCKWPISLLL